MNGKDIKKRLDNLLEKDRSKRFIEHIIRSYVPPYKVEKVFTELDDKFVCAITNAPLISLNEAKRLLTEQGMTANKFDNMSQRMFSEEAETHPFHKEVDGKQIGITSELSETYISYHTFEILYEWAVKQYFKGNKQVVRLLRKEEDMLLTKAKTFRDSDKSIHEEISKIESEKREKTTLGDLQQLKELKNKMNKN